MTSPSVGAPLLARISQRSVATPSPTQRSNVSAPATETIIESSENLVTPDLPAGRPRTGTGDEFADQLWVEWWPEDDSAAPRERFSRSLHDLTSTYVEHYWLPVLGPSSVMLVRRLAVNLSASPDGFALEVGDLAVALGIGHRGGRNGPMARTLQRCCSFGVTRVDHGHQLLVRRGLPSLSARQLARLPHTLQAAHRPNDHDAPPRVAHENERQQRCRTLALSLLELGEESLAAEQQLHRWRFHPAMAFDAVQWASGQLQEQRR